MARKPAGSAHAALTHTFSYMDGTTQKVTMTYGLLSTLAALVDDLAMTADLFNHSLTRDAALTLILSERDETGEIIKEVNSFTLNATPDEVNALIGWAGPLVMDFLLKAAENSAAMVMNEADRMQLLTSTLVGSKASSPSK